MSRAGVAEKSSAGFAATPTRALTDFSGSFSRETKREREREFASGLHAAPPGKNIKRHGARGLAIRRKTSLAVFFHGSGSCNIVSGPEVKCKFKAKPLRWKRLLDQQLENSVFRNEA